MQPPTETGGSVPQQRQFELPASGDVDAAALVLHLAAELNSQADLPTVLQTVTDTATTLSGAQFGAFFYNAFDDTGSSYVLHVISGADAESFFSLPSPRITPLFEPTFTGRGSVRTDDVVTDARFSGFPADHLPVRSYLATPVVGREGAVIGALLLGHPEPGVFTDDLGAGGAAGGRARRGRGRERPAVHRAERRARARRGARAEPAAAPGGHLPAGRHVQHRRRDRRPGRHPRHAPGDRADGCLPPRRRRPARPARPGDPATATSPRRTAWSAAVDVSGEPDGLRASLGLGGQDLAHFASVPLSAPTMARDAAADGEGSSRSATAAEFLRGLPGAGAGDARPCTRRSPCRCGSSAPTTAASR